MTFSLKNIRGLRSEFAGEDGGITIMNLYFTAVLAMASGLAIDFANLTQARTQLQVAADAAAHAAIYTRETSDVNTARDVAIRTARANMPVEMSAPST